VTVSELELALASVERRIVDACTRAGRARNEVQLIAVSKRKPAQQIREAYALGLRDFGENYVQELAAKHAELADLPELRWHMIGHLQTNKAKSVVPIVHAIHTVDSERLGRELERRAAASGHRARVFIEVNLAGEAQKSGCIPADLPALITALARCPSLELVGLMTIPPVAETAEATRPRFAQLCALARSQTVPLARLSMGMSLDFEVAIEEGATDIRVGTALFGARTIATNAPR
jgi:hypothetical protein